MRVALDELKEQHVLATDALRENRKKAAQVMSAAAPAPHGPARRGVRAMASASRNACIHTSMQRHIMKH